MERHRFDWVPTPDEVATIVEELRPIVERFARRSLQELAAAGAGAR